MSLSIESVLQRVRFRRLLSWVGLTAAAVCGANLYSAELSSPTTVIVKGGTADTLIEYSSRGSAVAGLQFDLRYDRSVIYIEVTIGSAALAAGKTLTTNVLPNGDIRVLIFGLNGTVIADGSVAALSVRVGTFTPTGPQTLSFSNIVGVTSDGNTSVSVNAREGKIIAIPNGQAN